MDQEHDCHLPHEVGRPARNGDFNMRRTHAPFFSLIIYPSNHIVQMVSSPRSLNN